MRLSIFGFEPTSKKTAPSVAKEANVLPPKNAKGQTKKNFLNKFSFFRNKLVILLIFSALLLIAVVCYIFLTGGFMFNKVTPEEYDGLPFDKSKYEQGVFVGNVVVHWEDLLRRYELLYDNSPENWSNLANWKNVLNQVNSDAILQNEGARKGLYDSKDNSKIDPLKVTRARNYFDSKGKEYLSGEVITVWFYDENIPSMELEPAKKITYDFMSEVRAKVLSNELTMKGAGDLIASNFKLAEIDPAYQANAYLRFTYISPEQSVFHDDYIDKKMRDLKSGEMSEIMIGHDFKADAKYEAYYAILKINEKTSQSEFPFKSSEQIIRKRILEGYKIEL